MQIIDIEQGTEAWHRTKWGKVGGTRSAGLRIASDNLMLELLGELTEEYDNEQESGFKSSAMDRGNELEPEARKRLIQYTGIDFKEYGWLQSSECKIIGISPDGMTEGQTKGAEFKCPGAKAHLKVCLSGEIPKEYIDQCVHFFTVNPKLETLYFCSFRPESIVPLKVIELNRWDKISIGPVKGVVGNISNTNLAKAKTLELELEGNIKKLNF